MPEERAVRPPRQARSREAWERILDVGAALLAEGGAEALTIGEVCRRSGTTPPTLYARVDGKAGLFAAVYERCMEQVHLTEDHAFAGLPHPGATRSQRVEDAVGAVEAVFTEHAALLRPLVASAAHDADLRRRGAHHARALLDRFVAALDVGGQAAEDAARAVFSEWVVRLVYGAGFYGAPEESTHDLRARLTRVVVSAVGA